MSMTFMRNPVAEAPPPARPQTDPVINKIPVKIPAIIYFYPFSTVFVNTHVNLSGSVWHHKLRNYFSSVFWDLFKYFPIYGYWRKQLKATYYFLLLKIQSGPVCSNSRPLNKNSSRKQMKRKTQHMCFSNAHNKSYIITWGQKMSSFSFWLSNCHIYI